MFSLYFFTHKIERIFFYHFCSKHSTNEKVGPLCRYFQKKMQRAYKGVIKGKLVKTSLKYGLYSLDRGIKLLSQTSGSDVYHQYYHGVLPLHLQLLQ